MRTTILVGRDALKVSVMISWADPSTCLPDRMEHSTVRGGRREMHYMNVGSHIHSSGTHHVMRIRVLLLTVSVVVCLYFVIGAYVLRFALDPLVLPRVAASAHADAPFFLRINGVGGNAMLVRRYGIAKVGCVVFFPGRHGIISGYSKELFPAFSSEGIAVLAVAYPGQNGAPGTPNLPEIQALAAQVVASAQATCPDHRVVLYGRSFGSMVAAYAAAKSHPTGLILDGAAPSFSSAIRRQLDSRWYLRPLTLLPVSAFLAHDYALTEALSNTLSVPAVVFQGTADSETPLAALQIAGVPSDLRLVAVSGGSHSTTYLLARGRVIQTTLSMLRAPRGQQ